MPHVLYARSVSDYMNLFDSPLDVGRRKRPLGS